jgi:hypothetical protein
MAEPQYVEFVTAAHNWLTGRQEHLRETFRLSLYERWDWDDDIGAIIFSSSGVPKVLAYGQLVGSVSKKSNTWLWSWANQHIEKRHQPDFTPIRRYGTDHSIWQLTTSKWEADETDGWEMTSISAYILKAVGAYRMPHEHLFSFAILTKVEWAQ